MDSLPETTSCTRGRGWPTLGALVASGPIAYGLGLGLASTVDGRAMSEAVCFDPATASHFALTRVIIATVMAVGAMLFLFAVPWLLGMLAVARVDGKRATAGIWSAIANTAALTLVCLLLRNTVGIDRGSFCVAWLSWTVVLAGLAGQPARCLSELRSLGRRWSAGLLIGGAVAVVAVVVFHREHFVQCFNGDGIETFELARSLRQHFLPYWEMGWVGYFGTDVTNPSLINSYWTCSLQILLGRQEISTRLLYWVAWLGTFGTALHMIGWGKPERDFAAALPLALVMFLSCLWYTFYVGWNPYTTDLANPGVTDALFTLFLLFSFDCLLHKDLSGWVVSILLGSLVLYAGVVMFLLTSIAALIWQPVPRGRMLRAVLAGTITALGVTLFYLAWGWLNGSLPGWWPTLRAEYVDDYVHPVVRGHLATLYGSYFLLGCGGVPALGLLLPFRRAARGNAQASDVKWERTVAAVTLAYLLIVLGGGIKNLHYLGPLLPLPLVLWLRTGRRLGTHPASSWAVAAAAAVPLLFCTWLCWPVSRPAFELHRQLGRFTTFATDSYEEACHWLWTSEISHKLYAGRHFGWYVGQHTWLYYAQLDADPAVPRPLVVTDGVQPSGENDLVLESDGVKLYCRDPKRRTWAEIQKPPEGRRRFPRVFQSIIRDPPPTD